MEEVIGYAVAGIARIGGLAVECLGAVGEAWVVRKAGQQPEQEGQDS
ncbi:hypothetical protein ACFC1R_26005 [Kitasatospora sp. NPDC056138]